MTNRSHSPNEIYLEFRSIGNSQKVVAIDARTGLEVSVTGPINTPRDKISKIAVQKLERRLKQLENDPNKI